jgi:hypothetical protein
MRYTIHLVGIAVILAFGLASEASARGFGAARGGVAVGARGGVAYGGAHVGGGVGPYGAGVGGARGGTYVGPRGTTVQGGQVGGVGVGPFGGVHAGGAEGVRVTTPGGRTYASGQAGGIGVGPAGGVRAGRVGGTAVGGPYGAVGAGYRGGVAVGPYGGVGVAGARVGVGHYTHYVSPTALRTQGAYVRTGFYRPYFTPTWYRAHVGAWVAPRWRVANFWAAPAWVNVAGYCGITGPAISYDYGSNVVIENNNVYFDGQQAATVEEYATQTADLANRGREATTNEIDEWQPLGVFGMIQGEEKMAQHIFQLAVNKSGIIRGNYYNALADSTQQVYGAVNTKTQKAAWSIGEKKDIVFEAGINNLTKDETPVLVHYGKDRTEQMVLVRLEQPKDGTP